MTKALELKVKFLSDWHIGEGASAYGNVDAIVRRSPQHGLPYVPAKTLTGIIRDGCERIVFGLDNGNTSGSWQSLLKLIFGNNAEDDDPTLQPAALSIQPAHFDADVLDALRNQSSLRDALIFLKPGVQIDAEGAAQDQMLRFEEMVLTGANLTASVTLDVPTSLQKQALALLSAGCQVVERLGGKRRRGNGRCTLTLVGSPDNEERKALLRRPPIIEAQQSAQTDTPKLADTGIASSGQWKVFALDLQLLTPVVIPQSTLGNVVTTRDHIPGSLLLPALNRWLRELLGELTTSALASGALQITNAYPAIGDQRLLPIPATIFKEKNADNFTNNLLVDPSDGVQRKQQRTGFVADDCLQLLPATVVSKARAGAVLVDILTTTHATIEDARQRPTGDVGGVFTYEAIHPSQAHFDRFTAELRIDVQLLSESINARLQTWIEACPKEVRIGRAKKDDYGRVSLSCRSSTVATVVAHEDELTVWLTAPALLRDEALDPVCDAIGFAQALSQQIDALSKHDANITLTPIDSFARAWRDDGWNNAWQMQRATRFGLAAGSCFRLRADRSLSAELLGKLQAAGLGERRGEGYGEIRINPVLLQKAAIPVRATNSTNSSTKVAVTDVLSALSTSEDFIAILRGRAQRLTIRRCVFLHDQTFRQQLQWSIDSPPNAQLGTLRNLMETLTDKRGAKRLLGWLEAMDKTANVTRANKWPAASRTLLKHHIENANGIWDTLELSDSDALGLPPGDSVCEKLRFEAIRLLWLFAIGRQLQDNQSISTEGSSTENATHGA